MVATVSRDTPGEDAAADARLSARAPEAVVCAPTCRRPEMLRATLASLAAQTGSIDFAVVVVDNDPLQAAGAAVAREFFADHRLAGACVIEPLPGNCRACNRALAEARRRFPSASFILMIDDDEVADPEWLARMVAAARDNHADIVGGPVTPHFPDGAPGALARHPVYWPAYDRSGRVPMIYGSGNFLVRRRALESLAEPQFDLRFNFLGGGDTEFFTRCRRAGLTFYWEQTARIVETTPRERLRARWVLRRGLRIGAINFLIDRAGARTLAARLALIAKNGALVPVSMFRSLRLIACGEPALVAVHPMAIAIGRLLAWFGVETHQYRAPAGEPKR